ncbi:MAG: gliding motility lipoprotein GldH [Proteiniphilum sp.]
MMRSIRFLVTGLLFSSLLSCAEGEVYYRFHHIENGRWYRDSTLVFSMDSVALHPAKRYDVTIEITTNRAYPYRDLWVQINQNLTDTLFRSDTLHYRLADDYGRWLGSGAGGLNQLSLPYLSSVPLVTTCPYAVHIRQTMTDDPLAGIEKVGVKVVAVNDGKP